MKRLIILFFSIISTAHAQTPYRFEAETGAGVLNLPGTDRTGWTVRQQLTAYLRPRVGISAGLTLGGSANIAPLRANPNQFGRPDPAGLNQFYARTERMADLSVVALPILTRRHQLAVRAGISAYRSNDTRVDSLIFFPGGRDYETVLRQTTTNRVAPLLGVSYDYRLSERWAVGVQGVAYFTSQSQPVTTVGLRTTYRFNLRADSLGFKPIEPGSFRAGMRVAANLSATNGRSVSGVYSLRGIGGLWAELPLSLTWQIRGEINYAMRRYQVNERRQVNGRTLPAFGNLNYLEMPLLFRNEVAERWYLYGGAYIAFLLNGRAESDGQPVTVERGAITGLMLGADYQLSNRLALDVRYQRDLLGLSSTPYGGLHGFQFGMNWVFK